MRLQRGGEPLIWISETDADERGLDDGDQARIFNQIGSFQAQAKISPSLRPGQLVVNHAWEPHQFKNRSSHQSVIASPLNPIALAGGYFHLQPTPLFGEPGGTDRGTRVEVERIA